MSVQVKVKRLFGAGKKTYRPGREAELPEALVKRLEKAHPPFVERIREPKAPRPVKPAKDDGAK